PSRIVAKWDVELGICVQRILQLGLQLEYLTAKVHHVFRVYLCCLRLNTLNPLTFPLLKPALTHQGRFIVTIRKHSTPSLL
ncbi:hypothetical protein, partial [Prevotella corporis]|uniref:hypothetical protein n=1 Tax=Prevotella corporis TaxID=28128 RepID=UPI001E5EE558